MSKTRRRTSTEDKAERQEQRELLKQFRRAWLERTKPTDRFSITTKETEKENENGKK
jgi:hypothetical protein